MDGSDIAPPRRAPLPPSAASCLLGSLRVSRRAALADQRGADSACAEQPGHIFAFIGTPPRRHRRGHPRRTPSAPLDSGAPRWDGRAPPSPGVTRAIWPNPRIPPCWALPDLRTDGMVRAGVRARRNVPGDAAVGSTAWRRGTYASSPRSSRTDGGTHRVRSAGRPPALDVARAPTSLRAPGPAPRWASSTRREKLLDLLLAGLTRGLIGARGRLLRDLLPAPERACQSR